MSFENVEVYVRMAEYGYEGESVRFATIDEIQAFTFFNEDNDSVEMSTTAQPYAPDTRMEYVMVYVNGCYVERWERSYGQWEQGYGDKKKVWKTIKI